MGAALVETGAGAAIMGMAYDGMVVAAIGAALPVVAGVPVGVQSKAAAKKGRGHRAKIKFAPKQIKPKLVKDEASAWRCKWSSVVGMKSKVSGRGDGLFASRPLRKGTQIDYYGVRLTRAMWDDRNDQSYCVQVHSGARVVP